MESNIYQPLDGCKILLASHSPRRRELLGKLDVELAILPLIEVDESYPSELKSEDVAAYISRKKATPYIEQLTDHDILLTADTVVICGGEVLGKPSDEQNAVEMLQLLSGQTHKVVTGVTLATRHQMVTFSEITEVDFAQLSSDEINYYVDKYRPLDKAGAYGIQEWIGYVGISGIRGDYYNVMGLPLHSLYNHLVELAKV